MGFLYPFIPQLQNGYHIPAITGNGQFYFVSPIGSDSNDGSLTSPWKTAAKAASSATTPGDVVIFEPGTYSPDLVIPPSGQSGAPITWVSRSVGQAVLDGLYRIDFGLLLENCSHFHLRGFEVKNYAYGALWSNSNTTSSEYTEHVKVDYCYIHHNGRTPRSIEDTVGYVGLYTNGMTRFWRVENSVFYLNGRKPNHDFDDETSGDNHSYRHDHGWYAQGYGHICNKNHFFEHTSGYPIRPGGYWKGSALSAGKYSVSITNCKFYDSGNETPYGDVHGLIAAYNNQTAHGGSLGTLKEPVLEVAECNAGVSQAGTGTNTLVGFFNDPLSTGNTTTQHRFVNNTCAALDVYNESQSWMSGHSGITASGNTKSTSASAQELADWIVEASSLVGVPVRQAGSYPWSPHILSESSQAGFWDARVSSRVTEVSGVVSSWASLFRNSTSFTQATSADRPDYLSDHVAPQDASDFLTGASGLHGLTNGDFTLLIVGSDNKASAGGWIRLTGYGGGNGLKFNHYGSSWYAYFDEGGGGQNGSFSSADYTANSDVMFSFKHDSNTDFEVFQDGASKLNFTPATPWTSSAAILFPTSGGVGMDKCRAILAIGGDASTATRQLAEGFLAWQFGLQGNLPLGHPWKDQYPSVGG